MTRCSSTLDMRPIADVELQCANIAGHEGPHNATLPGEHVVRSWIVGVTPGAK